MTSAPSIGSGRARAKVRAAMGGALVLLGAASARADASPEDIAQARVLGTDGIHLADANDCANAIVKLDAAEKLFHAPTTLERLGECLVATGKVVAGSEMLLRVTREPLAPGAPAQFVAAQERAQKALPAAQARIAQLAIHVDGPAPAAVTITIDGASIPAAFLDTDRPTDPGAHEVKVAADGFLPAAARVTLADGEHRKLPLQLEPAPPPPPAAAPAAPAPAPAPATAAPPPASSGPPDRTPMWIAYGVGAAGLAVGTVFGILALSTHSSLTSACSPETNCPSSSQSDISALSTRAWVANAGFAVALLGAGVGTYFLLTTPDPSAPAPNASRAPSVRVSAWIGAGGGGLAGSF